MVSIRVRFSVQEIHVNPAPVSRPRAYLLQIDSYDILLHSRHLSVLPIVVFHPCCRQDIQTTAAVFYDTSSGRSAGSSLYSRQAGVSGFWCHVPSGTTCLSSSHLRRHSRFSEHSRPFCFPVLTKTPSCDSCVTITIHHYCLDTCHDSYNN